MLRSPTILLAPRATDRFFTAEDGDRFLATGVISCTGTEPPMRRRIGVPFVPVRRHIVGRIEALRLQEAAAAK